MFRSEVRKNLVQPAIDFYLHRYEKIHDGHLPASMLDVGGGVGYWTAAAQNRGVRACLMDYAEDALEFAKLQLGVEWTVLGDIGRSADYFEPSSFDFVLARHTVEHMPDPDGYLESIRRVLRPGGVLEIETPNVRSPEQFSHLAVIRQNFRMVRESNGDFSAIRALSVALSKAASGVNPPKHLWGFTARSLALLLERHGLTVRNVWKRPAGHRIFDPLYYETNPLRGRRGIGIPYYYWERLSAPLFIANGQNLAVMATRK